MRVWLSLLLCVTLRALGAQGTVVGTLHDSLHLAEGRRPIANAMVTLVELDRVARTDANGRFTFDRVPVGRHTLRFWSPALDVVGLSALTTAIEVTDGTLATAELATPSRATFAQLVCGAPLDPDDGILLGSVIDAVSGEPVANAVVRARWQETLIGRRNLTSRTRVEERRTDAGGDFAICGVPASDSFDVQAVLGARRTSAIIHALDEPLGRLDLRLTPDAGRRAR